MKWWNQWENKIWMLIPDKWKNFRRSRIGGFISGTNTELNQIIKVQILKEIKTAMILSGICIFCIIGIMVTTMSHPETIQIIRNEAGEGEHLEDVQIKVDGTKYQYELPVSEKIYTKKEEEKAFQEGFAYLEQKMLKNNQSLNEVRSNLQFLWEIPDSPLEVKWEFEDQSLVDMEGKVHNQSFTNHSKVTHVRLSLTYLNDKKEKIYTITIYPRKLTKTQVKAEQILLKIKQLEQKSRTEKFFQIPLQLSDGEILISKKTNPWLVFLILSLAAIPFMILRQLEQEKQKQKEVKKQSELEYSNILWQFILLLEAGFTIKSAWKKIVSDYEKKKQQMTESKCYVYEQMLYSYRQMELGCSQEQVFEMFSKKMSMKSYSKLMTLFLQNVTKGSKRMLEILKSEERQAFLDRCEQAKRMGEEADTKLLLPMGIMLLNILLLLMVPAYLQF